MMLFEKSFDIGEVVLNYAEGPNNGPPILFIPGSFGIWQNYQAIYPSIIDIHHIYSIDSRGRGKSSRANGQYQLKHMANDTIKFVKQVIKKPTVIVGHSEGGWIALYAAQQLPEYLRGLVILDSWLDLDRHIKELDSQKARDGYKVAQSMVGNTVDDLFKMLSEQNPDRDKDAVRHEALCWSLVDPDFLTLWSDGRLVEYFEGLDVAGFLESTRIPVLFIQADHEAGGMVSDDEVSGFLGNSMFRHVKMDGADHNLNVNPYDKPLIADPLKEFLFSFR